MKITGTLLIFLALTGCQKEYITYNGDSGIYFELTSRGIDNVSIPLGILPTETDFYDEDLRIELIGNVVDYDRPFSIKSIPEDELMTEEDLLKERIYAKEGVDYEIIDKNPVIKTNEATTYVKIRFLRNGSFKAATGKAGFQLEENEYFKFLYPLNPAAGTNTTRLVAFIKETVETPWWWMTNDPSYGTYGTDIFGTYSEKKSVLICGHMQIERQTWIYCENISELGGIGRLRYIGIVMQQYLDEQKAAGNIIYEEDNVTEMTMGNSSQL